VLAGGLNGAFAAELVVRWPDISTPNAQGMFRKSVISKTRQVWKLSVSFTVEMLAGVGMMYAQSQIGVLSSSDFTLIMLSSVVLGLSAFAFGCLSVRCPECRTRWVWMAVSKQHTDAWLPWLMSLSACPSCPAAAPSTDRAG
jgi:hypothetical protein